MTDETLLLHTRSLNVTDTAVSHFKEFTQKPMPIHVTQQMPGHM